MLSFSGLIMEAGLFHQHLLVLLPSRSVLYGICLPQKCHLAASQTTFHEERTVDNNGQNQGERPVLLYKTRLKPKEPTFFKACLGTLNPHTVVKSWSPSPPWILPKDQPLESLQHTAYNRTAPWRIRLATGLITHY